MDRQALLASVPNQAQWNEMNNSQRKHAVESLIEVTLNALTSDGKEPDGWEAADIGAALNAVLMGWYNAALASAIRALTPPDMRANVSGRTLDTPTTVQLLDALAYVKGSPVKGRANSVTTRFKA